MDGDDDAFRDAPCTMTAPHQRVTAPVRRAIVRTRQWLAQNQHPDGYWVAELEGDSILQSETILLLAYLGQADTPRAKQLARHLLRQQLSDGGWSMTPGGKVEISASVKAYFALKLTGHEPSSEPMQRAREAILRHGGADAVNSFTRFYLALLGQISYDCCPEVPPELVLLPQWCPINLYAMSAWTRTIVVPLSVMSACRPVAQIDPRRGIRELFIQSPDEWPELRCVGVESPRGLLSWDRFFRTVDRLLRFCRKRNWLPLRRRALAAAERWMLDRFKGSDGLGAIYPPMVWSIIALKCLGYADDSPAMRYCHEQLDGLLIEEGNTARMQPCKSPVWDTAIALRALADSGVDPQDDGLRSAVHWLLDMQIDKPGDWSRSVDAAPGGWCFEHANDFYPDVDDTAMVVMALWRQFSETDEPGVTLPPGLQLLAETTADTPREARQRIALLDRTTSALERAERWMRAMQNRDGGWGAFDRDNDRQFLCHVPFADHNAMTDPSTPDLTARVLEALGMLGRRVGDPAVDRAIAYLRRTQEADGSWYGRWGVNYIYGTWQVLTGLAAVGVPADDPLMASGANWLLAYQQACGGWGESADSYDDPTLRGQGPITASQTAWAILGLLAAGLEHHPAVLRGVRYLISAQSDDGTWQEPEFTGTGFPRVFYLRYHLYPIYFPLMALSRWIVASGASGVIGGPWADSEALA
jgi:squalene-hopene/tetraprenyl-beta-curcumene cyclase